MKEVFTKLEINKKIRLDAFQYAPSQTGLSLEREIVLLVGIYSKMGSSVFPAHCKTVTTNSDKHQITYNIMHVTFPCLPTFIKIITAVRSPTLQQKRSPK